MLKNQPNREFIVIHIVPQLPPAICGVGDYAVVVGRRMECLAAGVRCGYVAAGHRAAGDVDRKARRGTLGGAADAGALWRVVEEFVDETPAEKAAVVLHYSGYGYDPGGAPRWLAEAIERRPVWFSGRVVTFFHELYATGRPWQRAFWSSRRQRDIAVRVARASDALMTNRGESARWLECITGRLPGSIPNLPVPSNVGEPETVPEWGSRPSCAVLFGGAQFKEPFLTGNLSKATADLCHQLMIDKVTVVGARSGVNEAIFFSRGIEVIQAGMLPAAQVSEQFLAARLAFIDYFPGYRSKSGVLAAAASHGVPPIFPTASGPVDGLRFGENLWDLPSARSASREDAGNRLAGISDSIRAWYAGHDSSRHARTLVELSCRDGRQVA